MRLLWDETGFELVGAFCVAAFALGVAWTALEAMFGLGAAVAGPLSAAFAAVVLEVVSRRHYADRLEPAERRTASSPARSSAMVRADDGNGGAPVASDVRAGPAAPRGAPAVAAASASRPAAARAPIERPGEATPGRRGAATVAGRRAGTSRRAA